VSFPSYNKPSGLIDEIEGHLMKEEIKKYPGWFPDTTSLKNAWAQKHDDPAINQTLQDAMPMSLHLFHPEQVNRYLIPILL